MDLSALLNRGVSILDVWEFLQGSDTLSHLWASVRACNGIFNDQTSPYRMKEARKVYRSILQPRNDAHSKHNAQLILLKQWALLVSWVQPAMKVAFS